jgi:NAD(P)-dependent dehydrogenase (short-subunit alcohol dehydrogenase family)
VPGREWKAQAVLNRFAGKGVFISGAGSGIGRTTALAFGREGAFVLVTDVDSAAAVAVAEEIVAFGGSAVARTVDVTSSVQCEEAVHQILDDFGRLDVTFANAGVHSPGRAHELSPEEWDRVLSVDLTGVWNTVHASLVPMLSAASGTVVCTASVAGLRAVPATAAYAAAKAGVIGLVRQMAVDYAGCGVRLNAVCPGSIRTPLLEATYAAADGPSLDQLARRYPMARLGTVDEVAGLVLYLASPESGFITGQAIAIDGGLSSAAWVSDD